MAVTEFEGAIKVTKGDGAQQQVKTLQGDASKISIQLNNVQLFNYLLQLRTLATSSNNEASTEAKYSSRRIVIEKRFHSYKVNFLLCFQSEAREKSTLKSYDNIAGRPDSVGITE